ncbi:unnamed protein product, partial [Tenebrio molitor]
MYFSKISRGIGICIILFLVGTSAACGYVLCTTLDVEFWKKYSLLTFGSCIGFSCYLVVITKQKDYMKLVDEVFPTFWPLRSTGEDNYQHIYRQVKFINIFMVITVLSSFSTSTAGLPWYGDEYEIMLPVKVFTDCLGKKAPPFLALFYLSVYHVGFTMMACGFILIHFVFHLKYQYFLLNKRLQQLSDGPKNWNV